MERATEEEGGRATRAEGRRKERKGKVSSRRDFFFETFFFSYYTAVRRRATGVSRRARLRGTPIGVRVRLGSREFHAAEAANATLQSLGPSFRLALCDPKSSPRGHPLRGASPARRVFRAFLCVEKRASPVSLFASARSNSCAWRSRRLTRLGGARKTANAEPDSAACEVWARIAGGGVGGAMRRWRRGGGGASGGCARAKWRDGPRQPIPRKRGRRRGEGRRGRREVRRAEDERATRVALFAPPWTLCSGTRPPFEASAPPCSAWCQRGTMWVDEAVGAKGCAEAREEGRTPSDPGGKERATRASSPHAASAERSPRVEAVGRAPRAVPVVARDTSEAARRCF